MPILDRLAGLLRPKETKRDAVTLQSAGIVYGGGAGPPTGETARKLSAVYAAVEIRSNSMSVLPAYIMDTRSRRHADHGILRLLSERPNEAMTPSVRKKLLETSILLEGNAYDWIIRDPRTAQPVELIPLPGGLVQVWVDSNHVPWYDVTDPVTGEVFRLPNEDVCHYKGPSRDGYKGESVLHYARDCIQAGLAAQSYNLSFYQSGGQPAGILSVETDLSGYVKDANGNPTTTSKKDAIRKEWETVHSGPDNAHRVAILDFGMKYTPLTISNKDSQFVEQQEITVQDIARYFCVPLYKLQSGSQSYNANEQNSIEYVEQAIQPRVTQMEEEQTVKLLLPSDRERGLEVRYNLNALLRGDSASRSAYYRTMHDIGAYSVNDIRRLEDMPDVAGGDEYIASLNYVPLGDWAELSRNRNQATDNGPAEGEDGGESG